MNFYFTFTHWLYSYIYIYINKLKVKERQKKAGLLTIIVIILMYIYIYIYVYTHQKFIQQQQLLHCQNIICIKHSATHIKHICLETLRIVILASHIIMIMIWVIIISPQSVNFTCYTCLQKWMRKTISIVLRLSSSSSTTITLVYFNNNNSYCCYYWFEVYVLFIRDYSVHTHMSIVYAKCVLLDLPKIKW